MKVYIELARPFTLIAPALGFLSGAVTAIGARPHEVWSWQLLVPAFIGSAMAVVFNAGNNALNQIYDLDIDRVNKGKRPLPSGRLSIAQAWWFTGVTYALTLWLAWLVAPHGRHECFWIVVVAIVAIYPLVKTFQLSFTNARLGLGKKTEWVGLDNYRYLYNDKKFFDSLVHTVQFTVASVALETILGMIVALTIHSNFKGRGIVRTSMLVPWAIPTVVSAQMWKWMYDDTFGVINDALMRLGIIDTPVAWISETSTALWSVAAVDIQAR